MNGAIVSTVGWDTAVMSSGAAQYAPSNYKEVAGQMNTQGQSPSILDQFSTMHGWTGVGIEIDQSFLPALVVHSLTPGCSAQKCGAIMNGDQVLSFCTLSPVCC
jgi:hypothetical protein